MNQAIAELDKTKAYDLINQADALIWDNVHSLTLYQRPQIWGIKQGLANIGSYGFKTPVYQDIGFVK
jgi:peptide/nickel transport system substrate-binding protein